MKKELIKVTTPDLEVPSNELRKEAYELALSVWEMAPWIDYVEERVLAIRFNDGSEKFISILGSQGSYKAIAIYPNIGTYWRIRSLDQFDSHDMLDAFMSTNQLQLYFGKASELLRGEKTAIKSSGVKFPRGVNPSFISYISGFQQDAMGANEIRETMRAIKAFFAFSEKHEACEVRQLENPMDSITTYQEDKEGKWEKIEDDFSRLLPVAVTLDETLVNDVSKLNAHKTMVLECGVFPVPAGQTPSGRGKMSRFVVIVEGLSKYALHSELIESPDNRETDWTNIVECILKEVCKLGVRPKYFACSNVQVEGILNGLCTTRFKGSKVMERASCDGAKEVFEEVSAMLEMQR